MKKIITILLAFMMAVTPVAAIDTDGTPNVLIEKLASFTPQMRAQYIAMLRPFVTSDAGVAAGVDNVKNGLFESMLGITFTPIQEDMMVRGFKSFSCIKESTGLRLKYADIIQNKIPAEITEETKTGIQKLIDTATQKFPLIGNILSADGYTPESIANMLKFIPEFNGGALVTFENGEFYVKNINPEFERDFDAVWQGYRSESGKTVTAFGIADAIAAAFNLVSMPDRVFAAKALENLGVCQVVGDIIVPPGATVAETEHYTVVTDTSGIDSSITKGSLVIRTKTNIPEVIEILVTSDNPMIYKLADGKLEPVKKSVPTENGIMAAVEADTMYAIRNLSYPFVDADGWGKPYIAALNARGIINGKSETEFMPEAPITREEFIKLVVELFDLTDEGAECKFTDVPEGAWYRKYVASAQAAGITEGIGGGKFGTGAHITRQDMAKIINTILVSKGIELTGDGRQFPDEALIADYAKTHVFAISGHIISGDDKGNFNPLKNATRQEAAKMVFGMLKLYIS